MGTNFPGRNSRKAAKSLRQKQDQDGVQEPGTEQSIEDSQGPLDDFPHRG